MRYTEREDGFVRFSVLLLVLSLSVLVISISVLVTSDRKLIKSYEKRRVLYEEAEMLCKKILGYFNDCLVKEKNDSLNCEALQVISAEFAQYGIRIEAVSDLLNISLLKKEILSDKRISVYLFMHPNMEGKYGYLNAALTEPTVLERFFKEHEVKDRSELFPLLNYLPLLNVHNIDEDLISAVLEYCKVEDAVSKAHEINNKAQSYHGISYAELKEIISAGDTSEVWDFLGVKTQMWKVSFEYNDIRVELVIGAIPYRKDRIREVESYRILERRIS